MDSAEPLGTERYDRMSGWTVLTFAVVCGCGALLFLRNVADALGVVTRDLDRREHAARREHERRAEQQVVVAETVSTNAAG